MRTDGRRSRIAIGIALALLAPMAARAAGSREAKASLVSAAVAFVQTLAAGHFKAAEADFTEQMRQAAPPQKLSEIWQRLIGQVGPFQHAGRTETVPQGEYTFVIVRTDFKSRTLGIRVVFDSAGRIAGMQFVPPP